jgi:hypothetical protein
LYFYIFSQQRFRADTATIPALQASPARWLLCGHNINFKLTEQEIFMKNTNRQIIIFTLIIILLCFLSVLIFTLPALVGQFNLTTKSNIGSAIGGITAPVIGVISAILLYLALTRQTQSNIDQRLKNESDIIFLLINQLDNEIASFYHKYTQGKEKVKFTGLEGINEFCNGYRYEYNIEQFKSDPKTSFKTWFEAGQITLTVETYDLIEKRIEISNLSFEMKQLFSKKLQTYYDCKLRLPLTNLSEAFEMYPHQKDDYTITIQNLVTRKIASTS